MIRKVVILNEYWFYPGKDGTDHIEGNQWKIDKALGKDVVSFYNKKGGILRVIFIGEMSTVKMANTLYIIEQECHLVFCGQKEVQYSPDFERHLKWLHGDKLVVK